MSEEFLSHSFQDAIHEIGFRHMSARDLNRDQMQWNQIIATAEEAGELLKAWRRYQGYARRAGELDDVLNEVADVVIAAALTAWSLNVDLNELIDIAFDKIFSRPFATDELSPTGEE